MDRLSHKPLLSILLLLETPDIQWLKQAVESIKHQLYDNWELCFGVYEPVDKTALEYLASLPGMNARIKSVSEIPGERTSTGWNRALEQCNGRWVVLLNQDDILPEHALFHIVTAINDNPDINLIYTDEDRIDHRGNRSAPYFKCDWNRDLLYSQNYVSHFSVYRREILEKIGGFRAGFEDAQDYDLTLRYIEQIDQGTIHHIPSVLCHRQDFSGRIETPDNLKAKSDETLRRALQEHFDRTGVAASVECSANGRRVRYALPDDCPLVSLIIPTRNKSDLLKTCINSIETRTTYSNYEILVVDNGSDDPETLAYLDSLKNNTRIRVLRDTRPFNYAQLNNSAVDEARGELIGLINNDTEVIADEWLSEMVSIALQDGVGFVGAKLLFPDGTIQHAGVILGIRGVAAHVLKLAPGDSPGYFSRAGQVNSFSALTGACLVIKKKIFHEAGGLDSENLAIAFNDIDLCLRVREIGYRNVYTPYALLYHHESASRGMEDTPEKKNRFANEVKFMKQRWGDQLLNDPAYSPNLTLESQDFSLAWPPRTVGPPY
jgi:GT2 family glycosyltransferase